MDQIIKPTWFNPAQSTPSNSRANPTREPQTGDPVSKPTRPAQSHDSPFKTDTNYTSEPKISDPVCKPDWVNPSNPNQVPKPTSSTASTPIPVTTRRISDSRSSQGYSSRSNSLESSSAPLKPHTGGDVRWEAINKVGSPINLSNFRLLKRIGYGDIGSVYLVELRGTNAYFAMKVMDKGSLASRNKLLRAQTEREILGLLDHPFLPTLYTYFETDKFYCLVMEFCSGGNLHSLRQKQPNKHFTEEAARLVPFLLPSLFLYICAIKLDSGFILCKYMFRFFNSCLVWLVRVLNLGHFF